MSEPAPEPVRPRPCGCGARPVLRDGFYVCVNPDCDGYGQICSTAKP